MLFTRVNNELVADLYYDLYDDEINDYQEYFDRRHEAMLNGGDWSNDDRIDNEKEYYMDSIKITYDISSDDEELD